MLSVRSLAWLAIGGGIAYVAIDVVLRFLRPAYSLLYNAESDYGRGPWYWLMDFNFLLRALQTDSRLEIIQRPSIMCQDNQTANITVE